MSVRIYTPQGTTGEEAAGDAGGGVPIQAK